MKGHIYKVIPIISAFVIRDSAAYNRYNTDSRYQSPRVSLTCFIAFLISSCFVQGWQQGLWWTDWLVFCHWRFILQAKVRISSSGWWISATARHLLISERLRPAESRISESEDEKTQEKSRLSGLKSGPGEGPGVSLQDQIYNTRYNGNRQLPHIDSNSTEHSLYCSLAPH